MSSVTRARSFTCPGRAERTQSPGRRPRLGVLAVVVTVGRDIGLDQRDVMELAAEAWYPGPE